MVLFKNNACYCCILAILKLQNDTEWPRREELLLVYSSNKVTFVSDWLIDGDEFIVKEPVGDKALTDNWTPTETAVLENAACANCDNICVLCGVVLRTCLCEFVPYTPVCRPHGAC